MTHRITLATSFLGSFKHLKRNIRKILDDRGVGHILQANQLSDGQRQTLLLMEGEAVALYAARTEIVAELQSIYPGICIPEWQEAASDTPLFGSRIGPTPNSLLRDSSGFEEQLAETAAEQTQGPERKWLRYLESGIIQIANTIQEGRQFAYEIQSSIESIKAKFVRITYKSTTVRLNISGCIGWPQLKQLIRDCEELRIEKPILKLYSLDGLKKVYKIDCLGLESEGHYYIETEEDLAPKFSPEMERFFDKLKTDRKRPEADIIKTKKVFTEQGILFDDLMATGDLAMTDEKLEKYGISQMGLRTAILAVIKSNQ